VDVAFCVGVHEAVIADPESTGNYILKFILELERIFKTIIVFVLHWFFDKIRGLFRRNVSSNLIAIERKKIEIVFKG
jgi:hypothetical protein